MWKAKISKVVAHIRVGQGPMGWPLQTSIERIDHLLEIWAQ
jgi:hypothetical protein